MPMSIAHRQFLWLACVVSLLLATLGVLASARHLAGLSAFTVAFTLGPLLLTYGWIRFCTVIWRPLYQQEVSPGWCLVLLFAFFAVIFLLNAGYYLFRHIME
jgi:hypothetical protein